MVYVKRELGKTGSRRAQVGRQGRVQGGAEGVGRSATVTGVKSIVCLIGADCIFTAVFCTRGW